MIKVIGLFLMFFSFSGLSAGFSFSSLGWFLFGLLMVCSKELFGHLLYIERQKVRAQYRRYK